LNTSIADSIDIFSSVYLVEFGSHSSSDHSFLREYLQTL
jgi:hypothetical protein